ncbi:hypothetical protein L3V82_07885 [Thiotrichales bacterium 19S3-7]|nr:hypothetical protein [Thiotrichales bacterium 19S3-7]MCF6802079.1 hypothetical protein [Thiotrichales bacterium 19S3-11]
MKEALFAEICKDIQRRIPDNSLFQNGVMFDNGFRDLDLPSAKTMDISYQSIFQSESMMKGRHYEGDFVCESSDTEIRIYSSPFNRGGHPGLATTGWVSCAGVIEEDKIRFHGGHFHPKATNVLHFMAAFIQNSLAAYDGKGFSSKEEMLTYLCEEFVIEVYYDDSDTARREAEETTFLELYNHMNEYGHFNSDDKSNKMHSEYRKLMQSRQRQKSESEPLLRDDSIISSSPRPIFIRDEVDKSDGCCTCVIL